MKKIKLLMPLLGVTALASTIIPTVASCGNNKVLVSLSSVDEDAQLSLNEAEINKEFKATISFVSETKQVAEIQIKVDDKFLTPQSDYEFNKATGGLVIYAKAVTNNINIIIVSEPIKLNIVISEYAALSVDVQDKQINKKGELFTKVTWNDPTRGLVNFEITNGTQTLVKDHDYTIDTITGDLHIFPNVATETLTIYAQTDYVEYSVMLVDSPETVQLVYDYAKPPIRLSKFDATIVWTDVNKCISDIKITIGDDELSPTNYTIGRVTGALTINPGVITGTIKIKVVLGDAPATSDFTTDPWSTIAFYAGEGVAALCLAYDCVPSDFIGLERKIQLNGYENTIHTVKVVGVGHDVINDTANATLTFQFETIYSDDDDGETVWLPFNVGEETNKWSSSSLREYLNSTFFDLLPTDIQNGIKTVRKITAVAPQNPSEEAKTETTDDKIFLPSLMNIYGEEALTQSEYAFSDADLQLYKAEGAQYQYYTDLFDITPDPYEGNSDLILLNYYEDEEDYFLRSPVLTPAEGSSWSYEWGISDYGYATEFNTLVDDEFGVAPLFCI